MVTIQLPQRVWAQQSGMPQTLRYFPLAGHSGRSSGTREWVVRGQPYIIVYEVGPPDAEEVMILGVFHGAQDRPADEDE